MPKETVPGNGPAPEKNEHRVDGRYFLLPPEQMEEQDRKKLTGDLDKVTDEMVTNLNRELSKGKKFLKAYGIDLENPAEPDKTPNIFVLRDGKVTPLAESGIRPGSPEFWKTAMQGQLFGYQLGEKHPRQIQAWLGVSGLVFRSGNSLDPEKEDTEFPTEPQEPSHGAPPEMPKQPSSTNPAAQKNYAKQMSFYYLRRTLQEVNRDAFGGQTARYQMEHSAWKRVNAQRETLRAARNNAAKQLSEQLGKTRTDEVLKSEAKEQKLQSSIEEAGRDMNYAASGIQNMVSVFGPTPYEQESWFAGQSKYAPGDLGKHLTPVDLTNRTLGKGEQERQVTAEDFGTLSLFSTLTRENGISLAKTSNPTMVDEHATAEAYRKMGFSEAEFLEIQKQNYLGVLIIDSFRPDSPRDPISARLPTVIEPARKNADAALQAYQTGDPGPLADIIARGIEYVNLATRTTTVMEETLVGLLQSASRLTDMMDRDPALKERASQRLEEMHAIYGQHPNVAPQNSMDEIIAKVRGYDKLLELKAKGDAARVKMLNAQAGKVTLTAEETETCLRDMLTGDLTQELYTTQSDASRKVALSYMKPLDDQIAKYETDPKLEFLTHSLTTTVQPFYTHKPDGEFILDAVNDPNAMKRVDDYVKRTVDQTMREAGNDPLKAFDAIRSQSISTLSRPLESWTPAGRIAFEAERSIGGFDPNDPPSYWTDAAVGARKHMAKLLAYRTTFDVRNKPENMNKVCYDSDGKDDLGKQIDEASESLLDLLNKTFPQNADVQKLSAELEKDPTGAFIEQRLAQRIALDTIPDNLPEALVFNAKDRVEALQEKLGDDVDGELTPATRRNFAAEMLVARILTDAKRGGEGLDRMVSVREFTDKAKWVRDQMALTYGDGSGGVKKLYADLERDPTGVIIAQKLGARLIRAGTPFKDVPREFYPSAKGTVEALQEGLRKAAPAERQGFAADILAARLLVGAKRGGEGLDRTVDLAKLREKSALVSKLIDQAYGNDARGRDGLLALADSGHGGKMLERLTRRIAGMDRLPEDLPEGMSPTAKERIEALQKKLKAQNSPDDKLRYTAEILAARAAVGAKRGGEGLTWQVGDVEKLERSVLRYKKALEQLEPKDLARLQQKALSGHGGEMTLEFQKKAAHLLAPENAEPQAERKEEPQAERKEEPKQEPQAERKEEPQAERKEEPKQEPQAERKEEPKQEPKAEQKRDDAALTVKDRLEALQKLLGAPEATLEGKRRCMAEMLAIRESVEKVETLRGKLARPFKNSDKLTQRTDEFEQQLSQLTPEDLTRLEQSGRDDLKNSLTEYQDKMLFTYDNYLLPTILKKTIDNKAEELKSATDVQQRNRCLAAIIRLGYIQDRLKPDAQRRSIRPEKLNETADKLVGSKEFEKFRSNPYYCAHCTIRAQEANAMGAIAFFSMSLTAQYKAVDEKDLAKLGRWANEIATGPKDKSTGPKDITTETKHKTTGPKDKTTGEVAPAPMVL